MPSEGLPRRYDDGQEDTTQGHSLDELAKGLADGSLSRRRALKVLAGALLGGSFLALFPGPASAEIEGQVGGGGGGGRRKRRRRRRRRGGDGGGGGAVPCGPGTCTGCCENQTNVCLPGNEDALCGKNGEICTNCGVTGGVCCDGVCHQEQCVPA